MPFRRNPARTAAVARLQSENTLSIVIVQISGGLKCTVGLEFIRLSSFQQYIAHFQDFAFQGF
jgi:hypothetical protein